MNMGTENVKKCGKSKLMCLHFLILEVSATVKYQLSSK